MPSWKITQSKKQLAKKTKWAVIVFSLIVVVLLLGNVYKFTKSLFSPWQSQTQKNYTWGGDFNINIVIKSKQISLLTFNPQDQKITIVDIPNNFYIEASLGFGKWLLSSIYDLGESQKGVGGAKLLKNSIRSQFGLPIDGFLEFSGEYSKKDTTTIIAEMKQNPLSLINMLPNLKTDLTPIELLKLKMGLSSVRFDKVKSIDLEKSQLLIEDKLPDGTSVFLPDIVKLDSVLTAEPSLINEHKSIAIFNSTEHPGLAQKAARLVTNIGGDVIITSNSGQKLKTTKVLGEKSKTLERLQQIFSTSGTIEPEEELSLSRAQINIFLGEDFID